MNNVQTLTNYVHSSLETACSQSLVKNVFIKNLNLGVVVVSDYTFQYNYITKRLTLLIHYKRTRYK